MKADVVVIGGGFYGCCTALLMRGFFKNVIILEKGRDLLTRASAVNQARIHTGFHYPRSLITAYRSFINCPKFVLDFPKAVIDNFQKIYAIARSGSKVNARRFYDMFKRMNAKISLAPSSLKSLFDQEMIEEVFLVHEVAFDAVILRDLLKERLLRNNIKIIYDQKVQKIEPYNNRSLRVKVNNQEDIYDAHYVFNCTYSQINQLLKNSGIELLPLKHELTETPLIQVPDDIKDLGITIMDGPFFSIMPYPSRRLHSLHHVRYTPHRSWIDGFDNYHSADSFLKNGGRQSKFIFMIKDAQRYLPVLKDAEYIESMYEIKTVLIQNEMDDGRPILYKQDHGIKNFSTVLGGKIDNIYDVLEMIADVKSAYKPKKDVGQYF